MNHPGCEQPGNFLPSTKSSASTLSWPTTPRLKNRIPTPGPKILQSNGNVGIDGGTFQAYFKDGKVQLAVRTSSFSGDIVVQHVDAITTKDATVSVHTPNICFSIEDPTGAVRAAMYFPAGPGH